MVDGVDMERGAVVSGNRGYYLKVCLGKLVERRLFQAALVSQEGLNLRPSKPGCNLRIHPGSWFDSALQVQHFTSIFASKITCLLMTKFRGTTAIHLFLK